MEALRKLLKKSGKEGLLDEVTKPGAGKNPLQAKAAESKEGVGARSERETGGESESDESAPSQGNSGASEGDDKIMNQILKLVSRSGKKTPQTSKHFM